MKVMKKRKKGEEREREGMRDEWRKGTRRNPDEREERGKKEQKEGRKHEKMGGGGGGTQTLRGNVLSSFSPPSALCLSAKMGRKEERLEVR